MLEAVTSWQTFLAALVIYGFAPGALLRLICLAFHRDDPRRHELRAELYAVPRLLRPVWVLEQLEVALFEGLGERIAWAATGTIIHRWRLESGVKLNRAYPDSFWIPDDSEKSLIEPGDTVKLIFRMKDGWGERMWVNVTKAKNRGRFVGVLHNHPAGIPRLAWGDNVKFHRDDIIDIQVDVIDSPKPRAALEPGE